MSTSEQPRRARVRALSWRAELQEVIRAFHAARHHDGSVPLTFTTVAYLGAQSWTRQHGAVESPLYRMGFTPTVPGADYDGLAYVHRTRPSVACHPG